MNSEKVDQALKGLPKEGFLKVGNVKRPSLTKQQKIALIRKGNEFFNKQDYGTAKRIFLTVGYGDGLARLGDYYYKKNNLLEALQMYWIAPAPDKRDILIKNIAAVIRSWLKNEGI